MSTMKAVQITKTGGIEALQYVDVPIPEPKKDEVLVKNAYCGVNFIDTYKSPSVIATDFQGTSVLVFTRHLKFP